MEQQHELPATNVAPNTNITPELIKSKISIALTAQNLFIQKLHNEAAALVLDEDHLEDIKKFLTRIKEASDIIDAQHKKIKEPYKLAGDKCDAVKNALKGELDQVVASRNIKAKYTSLCELIAKRAKQLEEEKAAEQRILSMINNMVIDYSQRVASCDTNEQLTDVERAINSQKTPNNAQKYGKFHQQAIDRYNEVLIPIIKNQKEKIHQKKLLEAQIAEAENNNDPAKVYQLTEKQELLDDEIRTNQIKVQEVAVSSDTNVEPVYATQVFPTVKARRTTFEAEIADTFEAAKKSLGLLSVELNKEAIKARIKDLKAQGVINDTDRTDVVIGGIRYFQKVLY